jgi:hypothetical protein
VNDHRIIGGYSQSRRLVLFVIFFLLASTVVLVGQAPPSHAASCFAHALTPLQFTSSTGEKRVRFRGYGDCTTGVKGIAVHIEGERDFVVVVSNDGYISQNTCGGPTHPSTIVRCPGTAFTYYAISTHVTSGCHRYSSEVIIDVVFGGNANWNYQVNQDPSATILAGPSCN